MSPLPEQNTIFLKCPYCGRVARVGRLQLAGKVKCGECGNVFIGSNAELVEGSVGEQGAAHEHRQVAEKRPADSSPLKQEYAPTPVKAQTGESAHHLHHKPPKPAPPIWVIPAVAVGLIGVIAAGISIYYVHTHPRVEIRDSSGRVVFRRRVTREEADRMRLEARTPQARPARAPAPTEDKPEPEPPQAPQAPAEPPPPDSQTPPAESEKLVWVSTIKQIEGDMPGSGHVVGLVKNLHEDVVAEVKLQVKILDYHDNLLASLTTICKFLPPAVEIPFSVEYEGLAHGESYFIDVVAVSVKTDQEIVCWEIDLRDLRLQYEPDRLIITGTTENETGRAAQDVFIYGDFFTRQGVHVGSARGRPEGRSALAPGESVSFTLVADRANTGAMPMVVKRFALRLVGRRSR